MSESNPKNAGVRLSLSRNRPFAWAMLAVILTVGGWLVYEIQRTIGLSSPRLWELLRDDRVFDLAMLDFFLTASWVVLVMIDRAGWKSPRLWISLPVACVVPSLGIVLFVLLDRGRREEVGDPADV